MLSQMSHSSTYFGKLKKQKSKLKQSGFQFLLQSLDRGKENCVPNLQTNNGLAHSVHIDPLLTAPVCSNVLNSSTVIQKNKKGSFFIENVKMLDRSDASISELCEQNNTKKSKKNKDVSYRSKKMSKQEQKDSNQQRSNNSAKVEKSVLEDLINKIKQYLTMSNEATSKDDFIFLKRNKKVQKVQSELITLILSIEEEELRQRRETKLRSSINTTKFSICQSEALKGKSNEEEYLKKINSLEFEKEKLHSLISQHELANIKMFIKINEGESQEIQLYKKHLAMLFEKYKKLEGIILSDKRKISQILTEKDQFQLKNKELLLQNSQLIKNLQQYQLQASKRQSIISQRDKSKKSQNLSLLQPKNYHSREQSYQSNYQNSLNQRGELYLQSVINSDIESENGFGSSITTTKSRMPVNKGGRLGINLSALLQSMKQQNISKLILQPLKLKKVIMQCRNSIISLQNVINQQNMELQNCLNVLQENSQKLKENENLIKNLEEKIVVLNKNLEKEKNRCLQKIISKGKQQQQELHVKKKSSQPMPLKNSRSQDQKQPKKKVIVEENGKIKINLEGIKSFSDEYRIIALQAQALENLLRRKQTLNQ